MPHEGQLAGDAMSNDHTAASGGETQLCRCIGPFMLVVELFLSDSFARPRYFPGTRGKEGSEERAVYK